MSFLVGYWNYEPPREFIVQPTWTLQGNSIEKGIDDSSRAPKNDRSAEKWFFSKECPHSDCKTELRACVNNCAEYPSVNHGH